MKRKIAIINQRYGLEVNGGSELHARVLAERLRDLYDVHVLTTCALDYVTWGNYYPTGWQKINEVSVLRFPVDHPRDQKEFGEVHTRLLTREYGNPATEQEWVDKQGPYSSEFLAYLKAHKDDYDVLIFVTYLYYLTIRGLPIAPEKSILIPTAHDEPMIKFGVFKDVFQLPQALVFNTEEEQVFIHQYFHNQHIPWDIVGVGIDPPRTLNSERFCKKFNLGNYLLYVGRIDEGKNCHILFRYFQEYKKRNPSTLKLVLMGKAVCEIPKHPDIIPLGFVSDEDKKDGMAGAQMLVLPSEFESLSLVVLESMIVGVPVIVNGKCEVLKGHCRRSNGGLYYQNYYEFEGAINYLIEHPEIRDAMGKNGISYVEQNYRWPVLLERLQKLIDGVQ